MSVTINGTSGVTFNDASSQNTAATGFGFKNRIINGAMVIDQRNAGASVTVNGAAVYTVDRWQAHDVTDGVYTAQQSSTAPAGFVNSLLLTVTTADTSIGASQYAFLTQPIEGFNIADLGWGTATAQTITISFWVRSSLTGTFGGSLRNNAGDRSYPFTYTISSANTWEQKTVTVAGETTGTWLTTNGVGIGLSFGLSVGSTFSGTAGAWAAGNYLSATGATSVVGTNGATFYITGVQLEKGSTATSFDYRPYGTELALCQRYYYKQLASSTSTLFGAGFNYSTTIGLYNIAFPVSMRTAPSALEQNGTAANYQIISAGLSTNCSSVPVFNSGDVFGSSVQFTVASGLTAGQGTIGRAGSTSAYLAWSAEL